MLHIDLVRTDDERLACFEVLKELRTNLERSQFLPTLARMAKEGFELAALWDDGEVRAVCGFRPIEMLATGRILYIDDLVTLARYRSRGYGARLLAFVRALACERQVAYLELDSGSRRTDAHRFYRAQGFEEIALHFSLPVLAGKWSEPDLAPAD